MSNTPNKLIQKVYTKYNNTCSDFMKNKVPFTYNLLQVKISLGSGLQSKSFASFEALQPRIAIIMWMLVDGIDRLGVNDNNIYRICLSINFLYLSTC